MSGAYLAFLCVYVTLSTMSTWMWKGMMVAFILGRGNERAMGWRAGVAVFLTVIITWDLLDKYAAVLARLWKVYVCSASFWC